MTILGMVVLVVMLLGWCSLGLLVIVGIRIETFGRSRSTTTKMRSGTSCCPLSTLLVHLWRRRDETCFCSTMAGRCVRTIIVCKGCIRSVSCGTDGRRNATHCVNESHGNPTTWRISASSSFSDPRDNRIASAPSAPSVPSVPFVPFVPLVVL